jgi:hypothetical protein
MNFIFFAFGFKSFFGTFYGGLILAISVKAEFDSFFVPVENCVEIP